MSNYTKGTNFATKDTLPTGDSGKIVKGTEIDNEFNAISSAISSKADTASPTFTGTPAAPTATTGSNTTQIANTAYVKGEIDAKNLGTMSTQNKGAVDIEGGTIDATVIGGGTAAAITGTTITASTGFVGNLTGNVTGTVSGNAGTVTNGVYTTNFTSSNQSLATNGYQKLPGGLIIQWGELDTIPDGNTAVTWNITFPNACLQATCCHGYSFSTNSDGAAGIFDLSTTGATIRNGSNPNNGSNTKMRWVAFGY